MQNIHNRYVYLLNWMDICNWVWLATRCHSLQKDILQTIKLIQFDFLSLSEQKKDT